MILCKFLYGLSASIRKEVFTKRILEYHLRSCRVTLLPNLEVKKYSQLIRLPNYKTTLEYATSECFLQIKSPILSEKKPCVIAFWLISEIFQRKSLVSWLYVCYVIIIIFVVVNINISIVMIIVLLGLSNTS